jgi:hypothetical protein
LDLDIALAERRAEAERGRQTTEVTPA